MAKDASRGDTTRNVGTVRSSVVEMRFPDRLPEINAMVRAGEGEIPVETITHVDPQTVRGIALTSTEGLAEGAEAVDTSRSLEVPVGDGLLGRVFNVFGEVIDGQGDLGAQTRRSIHRTPPRLERQSTKSEIFTTGIKAIDVLAPLELGGTAGLFGGAEVGKTVLIMEMINRHLKDERGGRLGDLTHFYYQQRQMSITGELLDIISGFEALEAEE
jgi:F-type H+/Na+-transporting ATPase subunit beta